MPLNNNIQGKTITSFGCSGQGLSFLPIPALPFYTPFGMQDSGSHTWAQKENNVVLETEGIQLSSSHTSPALHLAPFHLSTSPPSSCPPLLVQGLVDLLLRGYLRNRRIRLRGPDSDFTFINGKGRSSFLDSTSLRCSASIHRGSDTKHVNVKLCYMTVEQARVDQHSSA